jgi:enoyl-[acyl-carrier protein] reductase II
MTNRVLAHTGTTYPIVQAPMGWIARTQLASAVSRAGGLGVIETSSGETANCQAEIKKMAALWLPFGVNLPIRFLKDDAMLNFVCASGVKFVTTSAGSPAKFIAPLKGAGITVYHAVPTVDAALKCVDAGIDGLVVEGGEGGGFNSDVAGCCLVLAQAYPFERAVARLALEERVVGVLQRQDVVATVVENDSPSLVTIVRTAWPSPFSSRTTVISRLDGE